MIKLVKSYTHYLLVSLFLIVSCSENNKKRNELERMNLNGNVKVIKSFKYDVIEKFGEIQKRETSSDSSENQYFIFNNDGNILEENQYKTDGRIDYKHKSKYNDKGNLIEFDTYGSDGELDRKYIIKYDNKEHIKGGYQYYSDGELDYINIPRYDDKGNIIEWSFGDFNKRSYKFDDLRNITEETHYNSKGNIVSKINSKFNVKGNLIGVNNYNSDGSLEYNNIFKNDDRGNKLEEFQYNSDGSLKYLFSFKYEFDKNNNWIKRIEYEDEIPKHITERTIEYY